MIFLPKPKSWNQKNPSIKRKYGNPPKNHTQGRQHEAMPEVHASE